MKQFDSAFFQTVPPTKLTEGRRLKLHTEGWGLLTDYYLDSVKINHYKLGEMSSAATLKVGDRSGQITCVVKGKMVGLLFGLSTEEWSEIENMCAYKQQLFYRYFKHGLINNFTCEEKLFYNFCLTNQKTDVFVAVFQRCVNLRSKDKHDAILQILALRECDNETLDLYIKQLSKIS